MTFTANFQNEAQTGRLLAGGEINPFSAARTFDSLKSKARRQFLFATYDFEPRGE